MIVTVRKRFRDKDTLQIFNVGDVAEYDDERAMELVRGRFVTIKNEDISTEEDDTPTGNVDDENTGNEPDTDNSEKEEVTEETEKSATTNIAKEETNKPNKPGRKIKK